MSKTPAADSCLLVGIWTESSSSGVQRRQTPFNLLGLKHVMQGRPAWPLALDSVDRTSYDQRSHVRVRLS